MGTVIESVNVKDNMSGLHEKDKVAASENAFTDVLCETTADVLRKRMQEIKEDVLGYVNNRINDMVSEALQKIEILSTKNGGFLYSTDKYRDKRKINKKGMLLDKVFVERNSLLTDLFEIPHIRTIYNLFMVIFILLLLNSVITDMESGTIYVGTNMVRIAFAKLPMCICIWSFMQASTLGVYVAFTYWANQRFRFLPKSFMRTIWDYGWLSAFILYQIFFVIFSIKAMLDANLSIACSMIIILEQIRMMMKNHAFVRSVAPRYLSCKLHSETPRQSGPKFSQYLYFLFAPTLIYRDEYPRTKRVRRMVAICYFIECGVSIFFLAFILESVLPTSHAFSTQHLEWKWSVKYIIKSSIPVIAAFVTIHYILLHTWMNGWAEMLQFADRLFYKDWWNSTTYHMFFRTWNVVVHDWLYTYIYKDMYEIVVPHNRALSATIVFLISAIVHEYVLGFAFGFFYPVQFLLFISIGFPLFFARKTVSNVFMWLSLSLGNAVIVSLYTIEYCARQNCPPYSNYYLDLFIPRSWNC